MLPLAVRYILPITSSLRSKICFELCFEVSEVELLLVRRRIVDGDTCRAVVDVVVVVDVAVAGGGDTERTTTPSDASWRWSDSREASLVIEVDIAARFVADEGAGCWCSDVVEVDEGGCCTESGSECGGARGSGPATSAMVPDVVCASEGARLGGRCEWR